MYDLNDAEIKDGELLDAANNILSLLNYSQKLENEEDLFLDDFYVSIIGNLLSDIQPEITPGKTPEEKAKIMDNLIKTLSKAIEIDLPHIDGAAIILEHDKVSAKNLLDLISDLIKTIIDNNLEEGEGEEGEERNNHLSEKEIKIESKESKESNEDNNIYNLSSEKKDRKKLNLSESNELNKNIEIYNDENDDNNNENEKNEIIEEINYGDAESLKSDKKKKISSEPTKNIQIEEKPKEKEKENDLLNNINLLTNNSTASNKKNSSRKEEEKNITSSKKKNDKSESSNKKLKEERSSKKNNIINNDNNNNVNDSQDIPNISENSSMLNMNRSCLEQLEFQKMMNKLKDIENKVDNSYLRQTFSQNDISRYERNLADAERNQEYEEENENENDNHNENGNEKNKKNEKENENEKNEQNIDFDLDNNNLDKNKLIIDNIIYKEEDEQNASETPIMNVSHITDIDKEKDTENNNENAKNDNLEKNEEKKENVLNTSKKKQSSKIPEVIDTYKENESDTLKNSSKKKK